MPESSADEPLPESTPSQAAETAAEAAASSDLPEWEPLSPEILEDEAIRGDFVLRWAVVGLAFLWGCTQINDARVMVHVRSGEWLGQQGGLPTAIDPFSITTAERRWVNLPWLFDLFTAAVHQLGPVALSVTQAVLAAVAFWLLGSAVRPGIRTWWGSICSGLALLAVYPQFELRPELTTLVGLAAVMVLLISQESSPESNRLWSLPAVMWVWAQVDPRCWIGVLMLGGSLLGHRRRDVRPIVAAIAVTLLHPFLWETWLAPWRQYTIEYPALRASYPRPSPADLAWYPVWSEWVVTQFNHRIAAGLFLAVAAVIALGLNRSRAGFRDWAWFIAANGLSAATLHEWPVAAFVNAVLATVHGQDWYKQRFGQVYAVVNAEIAFSRGGRAVTVLAMLALAWLVISGRVDGPDGHRTGVGLSRSLAMELDSFRRLNDSAYDEAGFHFTLRQGDALIAAGRKSFVDHRVALFAGVGERDLLAQHRLARRSLRPSNPPPVTAEELGQAQQILEFYRISHVLPRLNASLSEPDYRTFVDLLSNPVWTLTDVFPSTAVFHRADDTAPDWKAFLAEHEVNVVERAFRKPLPRPLEPQDPIRPVTWTERWLSRERQALSAESLAASHWLRIVEVANRAPLPFQLGCATLALQAARQGTRSTPHVAEAHRLHAEVCQVLGLLEAAALADQRGAWTQSLRYYEAVAALHQATELQPENPRLAAQQYDLWQAVGKADAAYEALSRMLELVPPNEQQAADRQSMEARQLELAGAIAEIQTSSKTALAHHQNRLEIAIACHQAGCVQLAVKLLQEDAVLLEQQPQARLLVTLWLAELGRTAELLESAERLQVIAPRAVGGPWQDAQAFAALARGDDAAAIAAWKEAAQVARANRLQALLFTAPLGTSSNVWLGDVQFPAAHLTAVQESAGRLAQQATATALNIALCEILQGDPDAAAESLKGVLETSSESPLRPLVRVYWYCLQGTVLDQPAAEDPSAPNDQIPMKGPLFTPEP